MQQNKKINKIETEKAEPTQKICEISVINGKSLEIERKVNDENLSDNI